MIVGIGNDIIEIERIKNAIERTQLFKEKVFTEQEIKYAEKNRSKSRMWEVYAGRFAAKEAIAKAMGSGIKFSLKEIEIINNLDGKPEVILHNDLKEMYKEYMFLVTISHSRDYALATAICIKK